MRAFVNEPWNVLERFKKLDMKDIHQCDWDGYGSSWISSCHHDYRLAEREKPCHCDKCRKAFIKKSALHHPNPRENSLKSNECRNGFRDDSNHPTYPRVPLKEKPYKYHEFGKGLKQTACLERHQRIPTGEKSLKSNESDRGFRQNTHLHNHPGVHVGETPYRCDVCGKGF